MVKKRHRYARFSLFKTCLSCALLFIYLRRVLPCSSSSSSSRFLFSASAFGVLGSGKVMSLHEIALPAPIFSSFFVRLSPHAAKHNFNILVLRDEDVFSAMKQAFLKCIYITELNLCTCVYCVLNQSTSELLVFCPSLLLNLGCATLSHCLCSLAHNPNPFSGFSTPRESHCWTTTVT